MTDKIRFRVWREKWEFAGKKLPKTSRVIRRQCDECGHGKKIRQYASWRYASGKNDVIDYDTFLTTTLKNYLGAVKQASEVRRPAASLFGEEKP